MNVGRQEETKISPCSLKVESNRRTERRVGHGHRESAPCLLPPRPTYWLWELGQVIRCSLLVDLENRKTGKVRGFAQRSWPHILSPSASQVSSPAPTPVGQQGPFLPHHAWPSPHRWRGVADDRLMLCLLLPLIPGLTASAACPVANCWLPSLPSRSSP